MRKKQLIIIIAKWAMLLLLSVLAVTQSLKGENADTAGIIVAAATIILCAKSLSSFSQKNKRDFNGDSVFIEIVMVICFVLLAVLIVMKEKDKFTIFFHSVIIIGAVQYLAVNIGIVIKQIALKHRNKRKY